jgi:hypothetical protein
LTCFLEFYHFMDEPSNTMTFEVSRALNFH